MQYELLIKCGGIFHLICAAFHIIFPRMFKWEENLSTLPESNKTIIKESLYISNICILLFWLILAYIPFFYSYEMLTTQIGKSLLTCIVIKWIIRIFILHPIFSDIKSKVSIMRVVFFLSGFTLFLIPWIKYILLGGQ
jgi:hypothetical protein